jgi:LysM repeat protein
MKHFIYHSYRSSFFALLLCLMAFSGFAQTQPELQYHTVQEGETVYRITRMYGMTEAAFYELNPDARTVLSIGSKVAVYAKLPDKTPAIDSSAFHFHEVRQGETMFGITRQYGVSQDLLLSNNPKLAEEGLKAGMTLRIPKFPKRSPIEEKLATDEKPIRQIEEVSVEEAKYFIHVVEAGETMYSLSRTYGVTSNQLEALNPELADGLKEGMRLKIRKLESVVQQPDTNIRQPFTLYRIREGDKLRDILSTFSLTQQELERFNPRLNEGLVPGRMLLIPLVGKSGQEVKADSTLYSLEKAYPKGKVIRVAVFLPLDDVSEPNRPDWKKRWVNNNRVSLGFFSGLQVALDSLNRSGTQVSVIVFSDKERSEAMYATLDTMDLVIGPFFYRELSEVVGGMRKRGNSTIVVSPLSRQSEVLAYPNVFKCIPDDKSEYQELTELVPSLYPKSQVLIIHQNDSLLSYEAESLASEIRESGMEVSVHKDPSTRGGVHSVLPEYNQEKLIIILLGESKVFVNSTINGLRSTRREDIQLFVSNKTLYSPTIEARLLGTLEATRAEANFFRMDNPHAKSFISRYQNDYQRFPDKFAQQGFDVGFFFLNKIAGREEPIEPLHTYFSFKPAGAGAFVNQSFIWVKLDSELNQKIIYPVSDESESEKPKLIID